VALGLLAVLLAAPAAAVELRVAVAANFLPALERLRPRWESRSGDRLLASSAASGQLQAQIAAGAPFDVFLSADAERPQQLEVAGKVLAGSRFTYAIGRLALWSKTTAGVQQGEHWLRSQSYRHLALADPETAPYGVAARQLLQRLQLWDLLTRQQRLVTGASVAQAQQFADSGSAEAALVAYAQVLEGGAAGRGFHWLPPRDWYQPIRQDAAIVAASSRQAEARRFLDWLRSDPEAAAILRAAGYDLPAQ
jgi:molybdate transport system substrate-binding protein